MAIKYLYLDDDSLEAVSPYLRQLEAFSKELKIQHIPPKQYHDQIPFLRHEVFDGLILDLRLDEHANKQNGDTKAEYRATTLAQELRTRATEGEKEFPIVLWSTDAKLRKSYVRDDTAHDLFDLKCVKSEIESDAPRIARQLVSLAKGYKEIISISSKPKQQGGQFYKMLGFEDEPKVLDPRIVTAFVSVDGRVPTHEYARFILRELLGTSGPLIDEKTLAARLGVDIVKSEDWNVLLSKLKKTTYRGVFREGWLRWWTFHVEEWWESLGKKDVSPLRSTPAAERVARLQKKFKLEGLVKAEPIQSDYSQAYWTLCQVTQRPLDPRDGFVLNGEIKLWQDKKYVSSHAELTGERQRKELRLDPLEAAKVSRLKKAA